MNQFSQDRHQKVVKFVQELLLDESDRGSITPAVIEKKIDDVLALQPAWGEGLSREAVVDELIRRFSLWIGADTTIKSEVGHLAWLSSTRKAEWRYWQRYREWLERKLSWRSVEALDRSTDEVLGLLEDPHRTGPWDRRGLVDGHVQSGKTSHYTGLICKAADAGYKIIIVLAGLHNNLRSQTQVRLDEGFLGYETAPSADELKLAGVGEIDADPGIRPNYATNRSDAGDFNTIISQKLGVTPEQRPWLFVVKKNKTVLDRLLRWIHNHVANTVDPDTGRKLVTNLPLLMIDDEADHASVDTGEITFDADGNPDEDHQPTAINSRIRRILHSFSRCGYVGYTATPFANIFIHERGATEEEGPDLFPAAFIINLAAPSDYVGPSRLFGVRSGDGRTAGLPLVRAVTEEDIAEWMPSKHKTVHIPTFAGVESLPRSLVEAIDAFLLASAVRRLRGQRMQHASMLIHVTRFTAVQAEVTRQVEEHVYHMKQRLHRGIGNVGTLERLQQLWVEDFLVITDACRRADAGCAPEQTPDWEDVRAQVLEVLSDVDVRMVNGTAKDVLDYTSAGARPLTVIAIGGDKLARGLTLEGLTTSYFLRASRMYDTLMQMGRWFGYRPGFLDLCRLYTTSDLIDWFGHIADASEELREEFDLMAASGATPRQYGLKVQSHPVLMVTSQLKMRTARDLMLSFSGQVLETVAFHTSVSDLQVNVDAIHDFVSSLGRGTTDPQRSRGSGTAQWRGYLWEDVSSDDVCEFLLRYRTHPDAHKVNSALLVEFISGMAAGGELTKWTVALIGGGDGVRFNLAEGLELNTLKRNNTSLQEGRYSIGRLLSPRDESIDMDSAAWEAALASTRAAWHADPARSAHDKPPDAPNGPAIRKVRGFGAPGVEGHPERGLLLLYLLDPRHEWTGLAAGAPPVVAIGVSFPGSDSGLKVAYKINNVLWELEYGSAE